MSFVIKVFILTNKLKCQESFHSARVKIHTHWICTPMSGCRLAASDNTIWANIGTKCSDPVNPVTHSNHQTWRIQTTLKYLLVGCPMSQPLRGTVSPIAKHAIPVFHYNVILLKNTNRWQREEQNKLSEKERWVIHCYFLVSAAIVEV